MAMVEVMVNGEHLVQDNVDIKDVDRVIEDLESGKIRVKTTSKKKSSRKNEVVNGIEVINTVTLVEEPVVLEITSNPLEEVAVKKKGRGKNNANREKSNEIIKRLKGEEKTQKEILKVLCEEMNITHANAWYYLNKVYRD